jgi:CBS domain-containing protein
MRRAKKHVEPSFEEWSHHIEAGVSTLMTTPVAQVMRRGVPVVRDDVSEEALVELFLAHGVHGLPVVDADGFLVGFVSTTDLVRAHRDDGDDDGDQEIVEVNDLGAGFHAVPTIRTVGDVMTPVAVDLVESASLAKCALLMASHHLHQIPVVTELGRVVGMMTATDLLYWMLERVPHRVRPEEGREVH